MTNMIKDMHKNIKLRDWGVWTTFMEMKGESNHLLSSVVYMKTDDEAWSSFRRVFKNKIYPLNCIFIVSLDIKDMEVFTTEDGRKIVKISLYELVFYLKFILWNEKNNKDNNWNKIKHNEEINKRIIENSLFLFNGIDWSNVVLCFSLFNVNLSGGVISKRHILSPTDLRLSLYVLLFGMKMIKDENEINWNKFLSFSYKNPILSASINERYIEGNIPEDKEKDLNSYLLQNYETSRNIYIFKLIDLLTSKLDKKLTRLEDEKKKDESELKFYIESAKININKKNSDGLEMNNSNKISILEKNIEEVKYLINEEIKKIEIEKNKINELNLKDLIEKFNEIGKIDKSKIGRDLSRLTKFNKKRKKCKNKNKA